MPDRPSPQLAKKIGAIIVTANGDECMNTFLPITRELPYERPRGHLRMSLAITLLTMCLYPVAIAAGEPSPAVDRQACDVAWLDRSTLSPAKQCQLRALAKRCLPSDRCLVSCERGGGLPQIGGGCDHVCHSGAMTDEDIARNGGPTYTEESLGCFNTRVERRPEGGG